MFLISIQVKFPWKRLTRTSSSTVCYLLIIIISIVKNIETDIFLFVLQQNMKSVTIVTISIVTFPESTFLKIKCLCQNVNSIIVINRFRRRVTIPQGVNHESVTSTMSPEGILTIMAPKMMLEGKNKSYTVIFSFILLFNLFVGSNERVIPITMAPAAGSTNLPITHAAHHSGSS